jgi:N-carbamoyl-L-amino-acid hydrolase
MNVLMRYKVAALLFLFANQAPAQVAPENFRIDENRLNKTMQHMRTIGVNKAGGSDRVAYSDHNRAALAYLSSLMQESGLTPQIDVAGNLVGRREGRESNLAPLVTGSHIDTVPNGGHYDGIVGVMAGIEVARTLYESGYQLNHPFEVIAWSNEEGGKTGSRSYAGTVSSQELALSSLGDKALGEGIRFLGGYPDRLHSNVKQPGDIAAYIELHVEQGAILDREGISIGVVEGIVGIKRWNVTVLGFANHAGTTPMDQRKDAMYTAALMVVAIRQIITADPGRQVGTVGRLKTYPGAPNVVPGKVVFSLEIRDLDMDKIDHLSQRIQASATTIAEQNDTTVRFEQFYLSPAALTDERIRTLIDDAARKLGLEAKHMPSGAGHDAQSIKGIAPLGMIFVPSKDGVSHAPSEFTSEQQITDGANVLLKTVLGMDALFQ